MKLDPDITVITVDENNCEKHLVSTGRKQQMQERPLPIPFELPSNFQQKIMVGLKEQQLVGRARAKFITTIAEAMFRFKSYPTREEYQHVAMQIIKKWEFLGRQTGYVSYTSLTSFVNHILSVGFKGILCRSLDGPNGIPSQARWPKTRKANNTKDHETKAPCANLPCLHPITRRR